MATWATPLPFRRLTFRKAIRQAVAHSASARRFLSPASSPSKAGWPTWRRRPSGGITSRRRGDSGRVPDCSDLQPARFGIHAAAQRRRVALHADDAAGHFNHADRAAASGDGQEAQELPRSRARGDGDRSSPLLDDGNGDRPQAADGVAESSALVFELGATVAAGRPTQSLAGSQDDGRARLRAWRTQRSDAVSGSLERLDDAD